MKEGKVYNYKHTHVITHKQIHLLRHKQKQTTHIFTQTAKKIKTQKNHQHNHKHIKH